MLSWQSQYEMVQSLVSDVDATNLTLIQNLLRQGQRALESSLNIGYNIDTRTFSTVTDAIAGTSYRAYRLPENFQKLDQLYATSGTTRYNAALINDEELWQQMNTTTGVTSNFLQFCFIRGRSTLELYPIPSSACTATLIYQATTKPLSATDHTTGTILTLTNATAAVVGTGTAFTAAMAGRFFRIDADMEWYRILSYTDATHITLESPYQGTSIAAGTSNYTIGEFPRTPPDTHILPVYYAAWKYSMFRKDVQLAREWERQWKEGVSEAQSNYANMSTSRLVDSKPLGYRGVNPNFWPGGMT